MRLAYNIAILCVCFCFCGISSAHALVFFDSFDDDAINSFWWTDDSSGSSSVAEQNNRLELTQGTNAPYGASILSFNYAITGDFEMTVDYGFITRPSNSRERFGVHFPTFCAVQRTDLPPEKYLTHFHSSPDFLAYGPNTTDISGALRVTRTGDLVATYYWNGSSWALIGSDTESYYSDNTAVQLQMWPGTTPAPNVVCYFDNFSLNAPSTPDRKDPTVPEPASMVLLGSGLAGLIGMRKKHRR